MNLHEFQGKSILKQYGVAIQEGRVASTPEEAHEVAVKLQEETGTGWFVVKAQILMITTRSLRERCVY